MLKFNIYTNVWYFNLPYKNYHIKNVILIDSPYFKLENEFMAVYIEQLSQKKSIKQLAHKNSRLNQLFKQGSIIARLNNILDEQLPPQLKKQFSIATFKQDKLVLITHSATLGTRFRFYQPQILSKLKLTAEFNKLSRIELKIRPLRHKPPTPKRRPLTISRVNAELLRQEAASTQDDRLRLALLKIAANADRTMT